jgi:hypothetical protein
MTEDVKIACKPCGCPVAVPYKSDRLAETSFRAMPGSAQPFTDPADIVGASKGHTISGGSTWLD